MVAVNVALHQVAKDCNGKRVSDVIVDGNRDPANEVGIESQCEGRNSFVEISMITFIKIHYVVVYAGQSEKKFVYIILSVNLINLSLTDCEIIFVFHRYH